MPIHHRPNIFLLSDFGTSDHYVAVMKAVILARCPDAEITDITHQVPPQQVEAGAYLLASAWPWLPPGSVVCAVVDPGVGTDRPAAVFHCDGKTIIAPNNGLCGFLPEKAEGRVLDQPQFWLEQISATFHGRDIFAPCAAFVAAGGDWRRLGSAATEPVKLQSASEEPGGARGRIIHFDHFGNAITNISTLPRVGEKCWAEVPGKVRCPVASTFSDAQPGKALAYRGSGECLEIAVRNGNAREIIGLQIGDPVHLTPEMTLK